MLPSKRGQLPDQIICREKANLAKINKAKYLNMRGHGEHGGGYI
jgi:hypothetical protein